MLTTTFLAAECPKLLVPAMNTHMLMNPATQDNLEKCRRYGMHVLESECGYLACGETGPGKMPEPEELFCYIERVIARPKDMRGKKVVVSAGATCEAMDPVRFITNHSSGRMGFAMARECMLRGAEVVIVRAAVTVEAPMFCQIIDVKSAQEMFEAVTRESEDADLVIMAAAVADYTPSEYSDEKVKKKEGDLSIPLKRTRDILAWLGEHKHDGQFLCGFSMETQNMIENSRAKLIRKNADMVVANNLKDPGAGFGTETNLVTLITAEGERQMELMSKEDVAHAVISEISDSMSQRGSM